MRSTLTAAIGTATAAGIDALIRTTGRRVARGDAPWLDCPLGPPERIGGEFYQRLAEERGLTVAPGTHHGLLPDFDALRGADFDPSAVDPEIRHFYEHTSRYRLEAWSEAPVATRFFLWWLTRFVSRPMDQLNFPVSSLELAGGMTSEVVPMLDPGRGTGLHRLAAADGGGRAGGLHRPVFGRPAGKCGGLLRESQFPGPGGQCDGLPPPRSVAGRFIPIDLPRPAVRRPRFLPHGAVRAGPLASPLLPHAA